MASIPTPEIIKKATASAERMLKHGDSDRALAALDILELASLDPLNADHYAERAKAILSGAEYTS